MDKSFDIRTIEVVLSGLRCANHCANSI